MKKFLSILLAAMLLLATAGVAFAATVTVADSDLLTDHDFYGYQIFAGTQKDGDETLSNVEWGSGINGDAFLTALKADAELGQFFADSDVYDDGVCDSAADVALAMAGIVDDSDAAKAIAKLAYANKVGNGVAVADTEFDAGYYLFVDQTVVEGQDAVRNAALLQLTGKGNFEIRVKTDKPTVEKKVQENTEYTSDEGYGAGYNDVADYDINESIKFRFYSDIPDMTYFDDYYFIFHDTMSAGLTLDSIDSVNVNGTELNYSQADDNCDVATHSFCIKVDLKLDGEAVNEIVKKGNQLVIEYTAHLNKDAVIAGEGNPNEVYLEFSNNPDGEGTDTGNSAPDKVIVFTYDVNIDKLDGATDTALPNVEFVLYKKDGETKLFAKTATNTAGDLYVKEWTAVVDAANDADGDYKNDTTGEWIFAADYILTTDANGKIRVVGLEDETYYAKEIKAADDSYNMPLTDFEIELTAETTNTQAMNYTDAASTVLGDVTQSEESPFVIENNKGATLPETGGIGTTLFYLFGGLMTAGSALMLVVRRRAESEEE